MRKSIALICIMFLIMALVVPAVASSDLSLNVSKSITEINVPLNEIHITGGNEEEFNGPSSFLVNNNNIYILDSVSSQIKLYVDGKLYSTISIPGNYYFIDMDIDENNIYLLDSHYNVVVYDIVNLSITKSLNIPKISDLSFSVNTGSITYTGDYLPKYIKYDNGIHITFQNNKEYIFDGTNLIPYKKMNLKLENETAQLDVSSKKIQIETNGKPEEVRYLSSDQTGNDYIKLVSIYQDSKGKRYVEECIHQYQNNNKVSSVILEDNGFFIPNRNVYVDKSGEVYQMIISKAGLSIKHLQKQKEYKQKYNLQKWEEVETPLTSQAIDNSTSSVSALAASWPLVKKSQLESVVDSYMSLSWTYNKSTNGNINRVQQSYRQYVTQPHTLSGYTDSSNHTISKMPYCWGGYDLPSSFKTKVNGTSYYAGNVSSDYSTIVPNTAGVDCSGFVCRAFLMADNNKLGTSTMVSTGAFISDTGNADMYDVWIKSGHTMLNISRMYAEGINGYYVYEATTKDKADECRFSFQDAGYVSGFSLYKYANFDSNN